MNISFRNGLTYEGSNGFEALVDGKIAGDFDVRTNQHTIDAIGHIGYAVREEFRGRGIGTLICKEAIKQARNFGITDVFICCASDNTHSRRIIEKCGGRFVSEKKCCSGAHDLLRFVITG